MLDTGLIAAQIAFLLLLYLFVWRIVRSSSKSIDPVADQQPKATAPPVVTPVVAASPAPPPAARPRPPEPAAMPAVVRLPPPVAAPPPLPEEPPHEPQPPPTPHEVPAEIAEEAGAPIGESPEHHPLLGDPSAPIEGEASLDHAPVRELDPEQSWTPAAAQAEGPGEAAADLDAHESVAEEHEESDAAAEVETVADEHPEGSDEGPPDAPAVVAGTGFSDTSSTRRARGDSGVINLANLAPKLIVEESPALATGFEMDLAGGLTIGRSGSSDVTIEDPFVSHMHARVLRRGAYYFVEDLGSTNGTFLNDQEVERDARLKVRDTLRVGQTVMRYEE